MTTFECERRLRCHIAVVPAFGSCRPLVPLSFLQATASAFDPARGAIRFSRLACAKHPSGVAKNKLRNQHCLGSSGVALGLDTDAGLPFSTRQALLASADASPSFKSLHRWGTRRQFPVQPNTIPRYHCSNRRKRRCTSTPHSETPVPDSSLQASHGLESRHLRTVSSARRLGRRQKAQRDSSDGERGPAPHRATARPAVAISQPPSSIAHPTLGGATPPCLQLPQLSSAGQVHTQRGATPRRRRVSQAHKRLRPPSRACSYCPAGRELSRRCAAPPRRHGLERN